MKRAWPYALFGAITLTCFWKFLFLGWTLYDVGTLQRYLGTASTDAPGWFASHRPRSIAATRSWSSRCSTAFTTKASTTESSASGTRISSAAIRSTTTRYSTRSIPPT